MYLETEKDPSHFCKTTNEEAAKFLFSTQAQAESRIGVFHRHHNHTPTAYFLLFVCLLMSVIYEYSVCSKKVNSTREIQCCLCVWFGVFQHKVAAQLKIAEFRKTKIIILLSDQTRQNLFQMTN